MQDGGVDSRPDDCAIGRPAGAVGLIGVVEQFLAIKFRHAGFDVPHDRIVPLRGDVHGTLNYRDFVFGFHRTQLRDFLGAVLDYQTGDAFGEQLEQSQVRGDRLGVKRQWVETRNGLGAFHRVIDGAGVAVVAVAAEDDVKAGLVAEGLGDFQSQAVPFFEFRIEGTQDQNLPQ